MTVFPGNQAFAVPGWQHGDASIRRSRLHIQAAMFLFPLDRQATQSQIVRITSPEGCKERPDALKSDRSHAIVLLNMGQLSAQVVSGHYEGLLIGAAPSKRTLTGHYENYTGLDEASGKARSSCIFYLRGLMTGEPPYQIET